MKYFLITLCLILSACDSPLLNHDRLSSKNQQQQIINQEGLYLPALDLWLSFNWTQGPHGNPTRVSSFEFRLFNVANVPTSVDPDIAIIHYGWMPDMDHGSADDGVLVELNTGHYAVEDFYFNMPGLWDIHLIFEKDGVVVDELKLTFII